MDIHQISARTHLVISMIERIELSVIIMEVFQAEVLSISS